MAKDQFENGKKPALKGLSSGLLSRGLRLAGVLSSAGKQAAKYKMLVKDQADSVRTAAVNRLLLEQVQVMVKHFNQMKGAAMKVGQMLSMYGEVFLPEEINGVLKSLQQNSTPMAWETLRAVLERELGAERLAELDIDPAPLASASVGQVHRARIRSTGQEIALKIQYPGVDKAIENDLKVLRSLFQIIELLPQVSHLDLLFEEVSSMLLQELDYGLELSLAREYREKLGGDSRFIVPEPIERYSRKRVLAMVFTPGVPVDSPEVKALPQERRDRLALNFLELYFNELFIWGMVQTDPHFGNYRVQLDPSGADRFVLFDFGAVRKLPPEFVANYQEMVCGALSEDPGRLGRAAHRIGFLQPDDPPALKEAFADFCFTMVEPFSADPARPWMLPDGSYDWGASDIPHRLTRKVSEVIRSFQVRVPPQEVVFLDRKTGGVFIFLSLLRARINGRPLLENFLPMLKVNGLK